MTEAKVELRPQGYCVTWRSAMMPAPAFWYFNQKQQALDCAASLRGEMSDEDYRARWLNTSHAPN